MFGMRSGCSRDLGPGKNFSAPRKFPCAVSFRLPQSHASDPFELARKLFGPLNVFMMFSVIMLFVELSMTKKNFSEPEKFFSVVLVSETQSQPTLRDVSRFQIGKQRVCTCAKQLCKQPKAFLFNNGWPRGAFLFLQAVLR